MSDINLAVIRDLIGDIQAPPEGLRFIMYCPNHKKPHSFPAHRQRCNDALAKVLDPAGVYAIAPLPAHATTDGATT
jgi:hypothetical protein